MSFHTARFVATLGVAVPERYVPVAPTQPEDTLSRRKAMLFELILQQDRARSVAHRAQRGADADRLSLEDLQRLQVAATSSFDRPRALAELRAR